MKSLILLTEELNLLKAVAAKLFNSRDTHSIFCLLQNLSSLKFTQQQVVSLVKVVLYQLN